MPRQVKPFQYKLWLHMEGITKGGDTIEGDEFYEPLELGSFKSKDTALAARVYIAEAAAE